MRGHGCTGLAGFWIDVFAGPQFVGPQFAGRGTPCLGAGRIPQQRQRLVKLIRAELALELQIAHRRVTDRPEECPEPSQISSACRHRRLSVLATASILPPAVPDKQ